MPYVAVPKAIFEDRDFGSITADHVVETSQEPTRTGLFDAWGNALYRVADRVEFGFIGRNGAR